MLKLLFSLILSSYLITILSFHIIKKRPKTIEVQLSNSNKLIITICLGLPLQCLNAKLSSSSNRLWVAGHLLAELGYNTRSSNTYVFNDQIQVDFTDNNYFLSGTTVKDQLRVGTFCIEQYSFIVVNTSFSLMNEYQGSLGLSYTSNHNKESILTQLFDSNLIEREMFYLQMTDKTKGVIDFGKYPPESKANKTKYKECSLIGTNIHWECEVYSIYYTNHLGEYSLYRNKANTTIEFSIDANGIFVPVEFYNSFLPIYLKKQFEKCTCFRRQLDKILTIYCDKMLVLDDLGEVAFVIGKWSIKLTPNDLFEYNSNKAEYAFAIKHDQTANRFIIGVPLYKSYTIIFNQSSKQIQLSKNMISIN